MVTMKPELIHSQDLQGNNLLHLAAKNRNSQLFSFLLKKAGNQALTAKNNVRSLLYSSVELLWISLNSTAQIS
jgi:ankyrin repeat protein